MLERISTRRTGIMRGLGRCQIGGFEGPVVFLQSDKRKDETTILGKDFEQKHQAQCVLSAKAGH